MAEKKFKITVRKFIEYHIDDHTEIESWGKMVKDALARDGRFEASAHEIFDGRDTLPGHLFESQFSDEDLINCVDFDEIPIKEIELIL